MMAKTLLTACIAFLCASASLREVQSAQRDQYGGWTGKTFEATGYFRLQKDGDAGRWWLASPEGNAYLIHAMDHCGLPVLSQRYNRAHWMKEWGLKPGASQAERQKAFYQQKVAKDRDYLGFNCLYSHQIPKGMKRAVPYIPRVETMKIQYWATKKSAWTEFKEENFLDVFADDYKERCAQSARKMVQQGWVKDPWIVGYGLTDSPILTVQMAMPHKAGFFHKPLPGVTTWEVRLRNLGADAPGKQAYVALMKQRYGNDVNRFNDSYNTAFESWDALAAAKNWRKRTDPSGNLHEEQDNHAFLLQILDKCWSEQVKAIRKIDPNHLVFGDTLNMNEPLSDDIIRVYAKHFEIITYQYYGATWQDHEAVMDRFRRVAPGKPIFSADSSWGVPYPPNMPEPLGPQCANEQVRAKRFTEVYESAYARPDFIGWGWCGWMDKWAIAEPDMQHGGLQDAFGKWHQPTADAMSRFGKRMYEIARPR